MEIFNDFALKTTKETVIIVDNALFIKVKRLGEI